MTDAHDPDRSKATGRLPFGELEVDLREALSAGTVPAPNSPGPGRPSVLADDQPGYAVYDAAPSNPPPNDHTSSGGPRSGAQRERQLDRYFQDLRLRDLRRGLTVAAGAAGAGTGTSSVVMSLADLYARALGGGVGIISTQSTRVAGPAQPLGTGAEVALRQMLERLAEVSSPADLARDLTRLPSGAMLLGLPVGSLTSAIGPQQVRLLVGALQRCFPLVLIDLGSIDDTHAASHGYLADMVGQFVLVASATTASLRLVADVLSVQGQDSARPQITVAINNVPASLQTEIAAVIASADDRHDGCSYLAVPHDGALPRHSADAGLSVGNLSRPTRIAIKELAQKLIVGRP